MLKSNVLPEGQDETEMWPLNPKRMKELKEQSEFLDAIIKAGEKLRVTPSYNYHDSCPNCKSRYYFQLYGSCNKKCDQCGTTY